jgi:hypothetical protein
MTCLQADQSDQRIGYHQDHPDLSHHVTQIIAMTIQTDRKAQDDTEKMILMLRTEDLQATELEAESVAGMSTAAIFIALDQMAQATLEIQVEVETEIKATDTALFVSVVALPTAIGSLRCMPTTTTVREITEAAVRPQTEDPTDV